MVYGFELLYKIYEEQGYNPSEIPSLIIQNNLFGFEIDSRATQLAGLAVLMKAREYSPRLLKKADIPKPNVLCFEDLPLTNSGVKEVLTKLGIKPTQELLHDLEAMQQATNLGSLIAPKSSRQELQTMAEKLEANKGIADLFLRNSIQKLANAISQLQKLAKKYCCVADNPPYMGGGAMNNELTSYVGAYYPDSKADIMACFMEAGINMLKQNGFISMVNMHSWMFLSSYEKLRQNIIRNLQFESILHLGMEAFDGIIGKVVQTAAWVLKNSKPNHKKFTCIRLVDYYDRRRWEKKSHFSNEKHHYKANQFDFEKIPGSPIGYWLGEKTIASFDSKKIADYGTSSPGIRTGKDLIFIRFWNEVSKNKFYSNAKDESFLNERPKVWFPITRGGPFRKWYGNNLNIIEGGSQFARIKALCHDYRLRESQFYFREGITWTMISSIQCSFRICPEGTLFGNGGPVLYIDNATKVVGLLNSKVVSVILNLLNPTLNYTKSDIEKIPVLPLDRIDEALINECINISATEWDSKETSWEFQRNQLLVHRGHDLEETYDLYCQYWNNKFFRLHSNEEEINRQFIEIYGLQDEIIPNVLLEEITILKEEASIENGQLHFYAHQVMAQFMSYAVGCMFGRYSLEREGLILASQDETVQNYYQKVGKSDIDVVFAPDKDNIIPILEDEWFEDDIVTRFYQFLKVCFGEKGIQKNLAFLEDCLGCSVRKYFIRQFYTDHIQRYQKRPIYWLFSSPKGHFNVLIYMHRYTTDTLNSILNKYLRTFMEKLKVRMENLKHIETSGSPAEKTKALKEMDKITIMLADCLDYERNILFPLATERIAIDLDNGVLVNYNCFGKAVKEVPGLNDAKTKKKVKEFDWIDPQIIR